MKLHKEGYPIIFKYFLILALILGIFHFFGGSAFWIFTFLYPPALLFFFLVVRFFRNPDRFSNFPDGKVISSADGKVVVIEEVYEKEYFNDKRIQVSVFMSPLNVHVNRYPINGTVDWVKHTPGKFLVAWAPKSSELNERTSVVIAQGKSQVMMRQIAGAVARRIVCYAKPGDTAQASAEMGMIKFGSRVDFFLPLGSQVLVTLEQKVSAGKTCIATLPTL